MAVDIGATMTISWPKTEALLVADTTIDYTAQKLAAIERAKVELYGSTTPPDEADIPSVAGYWIADRALIFLIPVGKEYYGTKRKRSDNVDGASVAYYDLLSMLNDLQRELESSVISKRDDALASISALASESGPATSGAGMAVSPMSRAMLRGPVPW